MGIYCLYHQRPGSAPAREDHGRRRTIAALSRQRRLQRSSTVYRGSRTLFCRDRRSHPEFSSATQTQSCAPTGESQFDGEPDSDADGRAACSSAGFTRGGGCASSSGRFSAATSDSGGYRARSGRASASNASIDSAGAGAGSILVTARTAPEGDRAAAPSGEASQTKAAQRDLLQHRGRTHQSHGGRLIRAVPERARTPVLHRVI